MVVAASLKGIRLFGMATKVRAKLTVIYSLRFGVTLVMLPLMLSGGARTQPLRKRDGPDAGRFH